MRSLEEEERARRALLLGPFGLGRPKRRSAAPPPDLLIDDCETLWTATTGLLRTVNATPTAGGSGYTAGDILDVTTGGAGGKVQVSTVDGGGAVTALVTAAYAGGFGGYTTGTGKATSGGTGTGCTVNITQINAPTCAISTLVVHDGTYSLRVITSSSTPQRSLLGYRAFDALDLSTLQSAKLWRYDSTGASTLRLCLCSDTAGRVVVDEFDISASGAGAAWAEIVRARTGGGALGASIQSVAIYQPNPAPAGTGLVYLDTIRASAEAA